MFKIRGRAVNTHSIAPHWNAGYGLRFVFWATPYVRSVILAPRAVACACACAAA